MKKVLILSYYFPPMATGRALRTLKLIKYFPQYNWEPYVITATPKRFYAKDNSLLEDFEDIKLFRTKGPKRNFLNDEKKISKFPNRRNFYSKFTQIFNIPDKQKKWAKKAGAFAEEIIEREKINLIFTSGPPFSIFNTALDLKEKYKIPLVVDYRDSWEHAPYRSYITPYHRLRNMKLEVDVLRFADEITTVNRRIKEHLIEDYPQVKHNDIYIVPHGFDSDDFNFPKDELPVTNKFRITHSGSFFDLCYPKYFFEALALAIEKKSELRTNLEAVFLGLLNKSDKELISKFGLSNVINNPGYVEHRESIKYLMSSNLLWLAINKGEGEQTISTQKIAEYFGARKPLLLCIPDGPVKQMLRGHDAFKICEPDEPNQIAQAIIEYYELWQNNKLPYPDETFIKKYDYENILPDLMRKFEFLIDIPHEVDVIGKKQINLVDH